MAFGDIIILKSGLVLAHRYLSLGYIVPLSCCLLWLALFVYGKLPVKRCDAEDKPRQRSGSFERACASQPQAFLDDDVVGLSAFYRLVKLLNYRWARWFHDLEFQGLENLPPPGTGALMISTHSTHNMDIFTGMTGIHEMTGRAPRGLMHRILFELYPCLRYVGLVPGERNTAKHLLKQGFVCWVLPGGGEEALCGHENAYGTHPRWADRRGFAHVARDAGVDVVPAFMQNAEEMRFNPLMLTANKLGLTRGCRRLVDLRVPALSWLVKQLSFAVWFSVCFLAVPVPVKLTVHLGSPVQVRAEDSVDDIAVRARHAMDELIAQHQPHGHSYLPGLRERFARRKAE